MGGPYPLLEPLVAVSRPPQIGGATGLGAPGNTLGRGSYDLQRILSALRGEARAAASANETNETNEN